MPLEFARKVMWRMLFRREKLEAESTTHRYRVVPGYFEFGSFRGVRHLQNEVEAMRVLDS